MTSSDSEGLSALHHEQRKFEPSREFAAQANARADLYDEAAADRLNYQLRTHIEGIAAPSALERYLHSYWLAGDERGIVEHTLEEGLAWKKP